MAALRKKHEATLQATRVAFSKQEQERVRTGQPAPPVVYSRSALAAYRRRVRRGQLNKTDKVSTVGRTGNITALSSALELTVHLAGCTPHTIAWYHRLFALPPWTCRSCRTALG